MARFWHLKSKNMLFLSLKREIFYSLLMAKGFFDSFNGLLRWGRGEVRTNFGT